jgi:hypothetical protein
MALRPALHGGTTVDTPPLGQLMLDTHDAPMRLHVQIEGLNAAKARKLAANPETLAGVEDRAVTDIRSGLVDLFVRTAVAGLLGAVGLALLVVRRLRAALVAAAVAVAAIGFGYYATWSTWNPKAIQEPRYTGLLTSAPTSPTTPWRRRRRHWPTWPARPATSTRSSTTTPSPPPCSTGWRPPCWPGTTTSTTATCSPAARGGWSRAPPAGRGCGR